MMTNPSFIEKYALNFSLLFFIASILLYIIPRLYLGAEFTIDNSVWGAFGDYLGGILNPIISIIVIVLLVTDLKFTRTEFAKSVEVQEKNQKELAKQVEIVTPKPRVVYYIELINGYFYSVLKNIGSEVAYDVVLETNQVEMGITDKTIMRNIKYLVPNQELKYKIGYLTMAGPRKVIEHKAFTKYSFDKNVYTEEFFIDKQLINDLKSISKLEGIEIKLDSIRNSIDSGLSK